MRGKSKCERERETQAHGNKYNRNLSNDVINKATNVSTDTMNEMRIERTCSFPRLVSRANREKRNREREQARTFLSCVQLLHTISNDLYFSFHSIRLYSFNTISYRYIFLVTREKLNNIFLFVSPNSME
jgi:hypothetical protein